MKNTTIIDRAIVLATDAHRGQMDKAALPYILHPLRVMTGLAVSNCEIVLASAVLHDTVEDTWVTLDDIRTTLTKGIKDKDDVVDAIVTTVDALSRRTDETYKDFILRASQDTYAPKIKVADIVDNLMRPSPPDYMTESLYQRYMDAVVTLEGLPAAKAVHEIVQSFFRAV